MKPMRIAVTGGRGRLAPFITDHFRATGSEVISFSRSAGDDFREVSLLAEPRAVADFDAILHLAWSTVPLTSEATPGLEQATDLPLLQNMLDACEAVPRAPHLVFFSTGAVYGNSVAPATEQTPCNPLGRYACAKLMAEEIIRTACVRHRALRCSILRVSNVFGSTNSSARPQGIIPLICRSIRDETLMSIWGNGENTKDYLFLTDFLDAVQAVVASGLTGTFNVASGQSLSVNNIVSLVEFSTGKKLRLARRAGYSWDVVESYISARKLRTATGWRPQHNLAEAVRELMEAEQQPAERNGFYGLWPRSATETASRTIVRHEHETEKMNSEPSCNWTTDEG
jgi:UDP-glucose 4-epimerase